LVVEGYWEDDLGNDELVRLKFYLSGLGLFESYEKGLVNKTSPGYLLNELKADPI
jgi:hypothetical protein